MKKKLILILLGVGAIFAVITIAKSFQKKEPKVSLTSYRAVGIVVGEETVKLLPSGGQIIVIVGETNAPVLAAELAEMRNVLRQHPAIAIKAIEVLLPDPQIDSLPVRTEHISRLLEQYPDVVALVSFYGFPVMSFAEIKRLRQPLPKMISVGGNVDGAKHLFAAGVDGFAVVPTSQPSSEEVRQRTAREFFNDYFQIVNSSSS